MHSSSLLVAYFAVIEHMIARLGNREEDEN